MKAPETLRALLNKSATARRQKKRHAGYKHHRQDSLNNGSPTLIAVSTLYQTF
jgi:hypothetical protein